MSEQVKHASDLPEAESQKHNPESLQYRSWFHPLTLGTCFAPCTSEQEKAVVLKHDPEDIHKSPPKDIITTPSKSAQAKTSHSPYASYYRSDARIWSLYLKETEAEDKELVLLWQNGLDSLLVFAGLFAGILTAFLIESRKGLQADPQRLLLQEILSTLRNDPIIPTSSFYPTTPSLHVNYLWFTSLTFTLIGALAGVLAKGWLAKYAPTSPGVSSSDACERHLRAIGAYKWHFSAVINGIPFLIQLALFLFFPGLVLFILDNSSGIGYTILLLIVFTAAIYLLGTVLPWFSPGCPFQTTMSDFIPGLAGNARYKHNRASSYRIGKSDSSHRLSFWDAIVDLCRKPGQTELEVTILSWIITNSTVEDNIEEAVIVVAGMPSAHLDAWGDTMAKSGAVSVLCERFSRCFKLSTDLQMTTANINRVEAYLYALLSVAKTDPKSCVELLGPGKQLHRWDNFQPCLQSLAFCVRTEILLAAGEDDHHEDWEQTKRSLKSMCQTGSPANLVKKLMDAATRSIERGGDRLQRTGTILFSLLTKIGKSSQQFSSLVTSSNRGIMDDRVASSTKNERDTIAKLCALFKDRDADIRDAASLGLIKLGYYGPFQVAIKSAVPQIIELLKDSDWHIQSAGASALDKIAEQSIFHETIKGVVPRIIELLKDSNWSVRSTADNAIGKLAERTAFHETIKGVVPQIIELLKDSDRNVQLAATSTIGKLAEQPAFHETIMGAISQIVELLKDSDLRVRLAVATSIGKLAGQPAFHEMIKGAVPHVVELLKDSDLRVRSAGATAISKLAEQSAFHETIKGVVPHIIESLKDSYLRVRAYGADAIGKLAEQSIFHEMIKGAIPQIIELLKESDRSVRLTAKDAIGKLAEKPTFHETIKGTIPQIIEFLKDSDMRVRSAGATAIGTLFEQSAFHEMINGAIPQVIELLKDRDWHVRSASASVVGSLAEKPAFYDTIKGTVPDIIEWLEDSNWYVRSAGARAIGKLAGQPPFYDTIKGAIPQTIELLKDRDWHVRSAGAHAIGKLAQQSLFHDAIQCAVPQIVELLKDSSWDVQSAATKALGIISGQIDIYPQLKMDMVNLHAQIVHENTAVANAAAIVFQAIAQRTDPVNWLGHGLSTFLAQSSSLSMVPKGSSHSYVDVRGSSYSSPILAACLNTNGNNCELRYNGIQCLSLLVSYIRKNTIFIPHFSTHVIAQLQSHVSELRYSATMAMGTCAKYTVFHEPIKGALPQIVELLKDSDLRIRLAGAAAIGKLAEQPAFHETIKGTVPQIIEFLKGSDVRVRSAVVTAISKLAEQPEFHETIQSAIPQIIELLKDSDSHVRSASASTVGRLAEKSGFHETIKKAIPQVIKLLKDRGWDVRSASTSALCRLAEIPAFHETIKSAIPQIIKFLKDSDLRIGSACATTIGKLAEQPEFHETIKSAIPQLIELLKGNDWHVRSASASTVGRLAEKPKFHETIKSAVPQIIELLKDNDWHVRSAGVTAAGNLAEKSAFYDTIKDAVPQIVELLKDRGWNVRSASASALGRLAQKPEFNETIKGAIPQIIVLLKDRDWHVRLASASAVGRLAEQPEFHETIKGAIPRILEFLAESDMHVRSGAATAIGKLAEQPAFYDVIKGAVPQIVELLKDSDSDVRSAAKSAIGKLAEKSRRLDLADRFLDPLLSSLTSLLKTDSPFAQSGAMDLLSDLLPELPGHAPASLPDKLTASDLLTVLKCKDSTVSASAARLFGVLATRSYVNASFSTDQFSAAILNVVLYAFACLDHVDIGFQACGTSILSVLIDHDGIFRDIISEVGAIRGFIQMFAKDISPRQQEQLLYSLQESGILTTL